MKKATFIFIILLVGNVFVSVGQRVESIDKVFTNFTTAWIGNDGGTQESHIPHDMLNLYVREDGTVATACTWDEGGSNVAVFKDRKLLSIPEGSGTGGWGRHSLGFVVLDKQYVYQLLSQNGCDGANKDKNVNGLPQFPTCDKREEWKTIRRYDVQTGLGAPFKRGFGYKGDMLIVGKGDKTQLQGLAIKDSYLYVSVTSDSQVYDSIKVYDKNTMSLCRQFPIEKGYKHLAADHKGNLWTIKGQEVICISGKDGHTIRAFSLPESVIPASVTFDPYHQRLLIPDCGRNLNVRIYDHLYTQPQLVKTFGTPQGVFSKADGYLQGQAGDRRFCGPRGVGVDKKGNIYVANQFIGGGRGSVLEVYNEASSKQLWKREGLIFTATADFDQRQNFTAYSPEKIHQLNLNKNGRADSLLAYTVNPFLFPQDERCKPNGAFITSTFKRCINGEDFLFVSDMYGGMLAGYRFDRSQYGFVGIPFMFATNGDPNKNKELTFWNDKNGDGIRQENEFQDIPEVNPYSMSFFVDKSGNIWRGSREQGFIFWKLKESVNGIPKYEPGKIFRLPEGIDGCKRLWYDPEKDELFLAGFSSASPDKKDTWWCMGSTITMYRNALRKMMNGEWQEIRQKPTTTLYIPFHVEDGTSKSHTNAKAFTVEGDYVFVALGRNGYICCYNRKDGSFVGRLEPGKEVNKQSGWCDFNYAINAMRDSQGVYRVFNEENAFGKILLYSIKDFKNTTKVTKAATN